MDYAQARIQARYGERPEESTWQALANARELGSLYEGIRACGLRRWIAGLDSASDSHAIEIALRARWRESVDELASWMPDAWRAATRWIACLPDLPAMCRLARGEPALPWMEHDPVLKDYACADPAERRLRLTQGALAFAPLSPQAEESGTVDIEAQVRHAWRLRWHECWPTRRHGAPLVQLADLIESGANEPLLLGRKALAHRLRMLFRETTLHPAVAFVFLALAAVDMTRLRAELLKHVLLREAGLAA